MMKLMRSFDDELHRRSWRPSTVFVAVSCSMSSVGWLRACVNECFVFVRYVYNHCVNFEGMHMPESKIAHEQPRSYRINQCNHNNRVRRVIG